ncbi:unnamed protein product, partial [Brachionus calyciflorus]
DQKQKISNLAKDSATFEALSLGKDSKRF